MEIEAVGGDLALLQLLVTSLASIALSVMLSDGQ